MVRARAAFMACRFDENPHGHETQSLPSGTKKLMEEQLGGDQHRQLFSEVLVAEDIDLGSRVHTLGFRCAWAFRQNIADSHITHWVARACIQLQSMYAMPLCHNTPASSPFITQCEHMRRVVSPILTRDEMSPADDRPHGFLAHTSPGGPVRAAVLGSAGTIFQVFTLEIRPEYSKLVCSSRPW